MPRVRSCHVPHLLRPCLQVLLVWLAVRLCTVASAEPITNLHQLTQALRFVTRTNQDVDLEATVCAASRPELGVLIVKDESGVELLHLGEFPQDIVAGTRIRIRHNACLLRRRESGIAISAQPVALNDGLHPRSAQTGEVFLRAGKVPVRVEWFNFWRFLALDVMWAVSGGTPQIIPPSNLWHAVISDSGETNYLPGVRAESYEGSWEALPDFNLLQPAKTGVVSNFTTDFRSRDEQVGIRFSGYLEVPRDGRYRFQLWSDDGSALFLGNPDVAVVPLARTEVPTAKRAALLGETFSSLDERRWLTVEGRVGFALQIGKGVKFDLGVGRHFISVTVADTNGLDLSALQDARVRLTGLGRGVITADETPVLGKLFCASAQDLVIVERAFGPGEPILPITSVAQVQNLPIERAREALPVRIRGTVTGAINTSQERWMSFQDDTRGIFVQLTNVTNAAPALGEMWEMEGRSGAGNFAPIVIADKLTRLGEGLLPAPVTPTWAELLNGSRDVQWAELQGLVTAIHSNTLSLHLPEGRLDVELQSGFEAALKPFLNSVVRIRGVLYAVWDAASREVRVGRVMMRSHTISVAVPAPTDPFDAVEKTPRELLLFDAQASAFRPVKVRGQIVYADPTVLFLQADGTGLRLLPMNRSDLRPGDLTEAVGYPDIARAELVLREAQLRKTGEAALPAPRKLEESSLTQANLNSTRVRVEGRLLGWHAEQGSPVLEMQAGTRLFLARISPGDDTSPLSLRPGSRLALDGVYVGRRHIQNSSEDNDSFELMMNSAADITVLSQPSWWTLPRLFALVGVLLVILIFTVIWNGQLRRLVEQRTHQLQHEIREREKVERQRALEAERARIARDLHDDLGSSLTEISVLASTGQLPQASATPPLDLFRSISTKARSLISALDVIVWAVDPEDNSLQSLADYLSGYTDEFFSHTNIACRFKVPVSFPTITLEGRVRHDLLLAVKEALNNVVRHADATEVEFAMAIAGGALEIDIADNGKGLEAATQSSGHGLKNLSARLQNLGGECRLERRADGGTLVRIRLPLAASGELTGKR